MQTDRYKLAHTGLPENAVAVLKKRYLERNARGEEVRRLYEE